MDLRFLALPLLLVLAACGGEGDGGAQAEQHYFVSYVDAQVYAENEDVLDECRGLAGTRSGGSDDSYPPGDSLIFTGDEEEQRRLEGCLEGLSNVRVLGPATTGMTAPPVLVGEPR